MIQTLALVFLDIAQNSLFRKLKSIRVVRICLCAHYWMGGICSMWYPLKWYLVHVVSSLRYTIYVVSSTLRHYHNHKQCELLTLRE